MKYITYIVLLLAFCSCGINKSDNNTISQAKAVASKYYKAFNSDKTGDVLNLFGKDMYASTDSVKMLAMIDDLKSKNGRVDSFNLTNTEIKSTILNGKTEKVVNLIYQVFYSTGHVAEEDFSFDVVNDTVKKIEGYESDKWKG